MIDAWATVLVHCSQPSIESMVYGIMMDCGLHIHRCSVWGYLLAKVIAPFAERSVQMKVTCQFAYVAALPRVYEEAMARLITNDHSTHFLNLDVSSVTITWISVVEALSPNFGQECILTNPIIDNRIPLKWIQHGFHFGFQYMVEHLVDGDYHYKEHCVAYGQMLDLLDSHGIPPAYPLWDGWFYPSVHDWK